MSLRPADQSAGGAACWAAEQLLLDSQWQARTVILRLAGLYGPQRLPRLRQLQAGEPLTASPDGLINLIHVEDAVQAIMRAAEMPMELPRLFLIADGHPVQRRQFYEELSRCFQTPAPTFQLRQGDKGRSGRSGGCKRVSNQRMTTELGVVLKYPSYREGLAAMAGPA